MRRYEGALVQIEAEHEGDYTSGHAVRRRELAHAALAATRTPEPDREAGRAEPYNIGRAMDREAVDRLYGAGTSPERSEGDTPPATADEAERASKEFCDSIGCTKVHHLRDELPAFLRTREAAAREAGRSKLVRGFVAYLHDRAAQYKPDHWMREFLAEASDDLRDGTFVERLEAGELDDLLAARRPGGGKP